MVGIIGYIGWELLVVKRVWIPLPVPLSILPQGPPSIVVRVLPRWCLGWEGQVWDTLQGMVGLVPSNLRDSKWDIGYRGNKGIGACPKWLRLRLGALRSMVSLSRGIQRINALMASRTNGNIHANGWLGVTSKGSINLLMGANINNSPSLE